MTGMLLVMASLVLTPDNFEIVADADKNALATAEMKTLLGEAFGTEIPVVYWPSGTRKTISLEVDPTFARDDIRLVTDENGVRIINGAARIYGVYEFLERYAGMRFYFPGPLGTIVPKRASLEVPFGTVDVKPDYTIRACDMSWGLNGEWYSVDRPGQLADTVESKRLRDIATARMRLAPRIMCCHGLSRSFHLLERFGEDRPEYFALMKADDGTLYRDAAQSKWTGHRGQLCHTSAVWEEVYKETVRRLRSGEPYVDISAADGMQKCLCDKCQAAYSKDPNDTQWATDLIWGRTIELGNRLLAEGIPGYITQAAYPPYNRIPDMTFPSNVLVEVAMNGAWSLVNADRIARENAQIRAWVQKMGHKVFIWNYTGKFGRKMRNVDIPQMTPRAIGAYYKSLPDAIIGGYLESRTDRWIYNYLNYYVYNKVSWDTKTDVDALLDEHYRLMFGPAADEMRAYFERLEDTWMSRISGNVVETDLGPQIREPTEYQKWVDIYSPDVLAEFDGYLDRAMAKVPAGSIEAQRIAFFRRHFQLPLRNASDAYLDKVDAIRNSVRREGRENRSILKGTRFDAPEEFEFDGETPNFRYYSQPLNGLIKPNTKYLVSYFVKVEDVVSQVRGVNGGACIRFSDGKAGRLFPDPDGRIGTRDWLYQEYEQTTSPELGEEPYLRIGVESASGKAWFKGVRIEEVE